ncbi:DUF2334 domain-containing protein [Methylocystis parvus]|uniref:DUF2334 domain-containing protein n=1 Tax=Methylocystis parvus TaxID=134 RepID=UPI003C71CD70
MSSEFKIRRRQLLLGVAAGLAQSAVPSNILAEQLEPVTPRLGKRRGAQDDMIPKDPSNPFFRPQGGRRTKPVEVPRSIDGEGLEKEDKKRKDKGALLEPESEPEAKIEFAAATDADEGLIQTAAFTIPALSLDDENIETVQVAAPSGTLVLFDTSGAWGWLGELYGIMIANLASHFGSYTLMPVNQYTAGKMASYKAVVYVGSTYEETGLATSPFLTDIPNNQTVNVVWIAHNIWLLPSLSATYNIPLTFYEYPSPTSPMRVVDAVKYKGVSFKRYDQNADGIMTFGALGAGVTALANCVRKDLTEFPWAVRSKNLTYIGENPLVYLTEGDRYLIFCDLLFDALGATPVATGPRAILRLEDNDFQSEPTKLRQVADWLQSQGVPFGYHIVPRYRDPLGFYNNGAAQNIAFTNRSQRAFRNALVYLQGKGGVPILHGWTHQYYNTANDPNGLPYMLNPETGVSADDCEFFRLIWNASTSTFTYAGPLPEDLANHRNKVNTWVAGRMTSALNEITTAFTNDGLTAAKVTANTPTLFTTPHYLGTATTMMASSVRFAARAERALYFGGTLAAKAASPFDYTKIDYTKLAGQYFPYTVRDIYGGKVLPDTLGSIEPTAYLGYAARLPEDIIADAARIKAVRDGVAAFQYHSYLDISYLQTVVTGLKNLGYTFVAPTSL